MNEHFATVVDEAEFEYRRREYDAKRALIARSCPMCGGGCELSPGVDGTRLLFCSGRCGWTGWFFHREAWDA